MPTVFLTCTIVGGVLLLAQLGFGVFGIGDHDIHGHDTPTHELQLFSLRALGAGVAFFGVGGLAGGGLGWSASLSLISAVLLGGAAMTGVALAMRAMLGLERDATIQIGRAVGEPATVYVPIPPALAGVGKVTLVLQGRTIESAAVTSATHVLSTGTAVVVVDVRDDKMLEVVPLSSIEGVLQ